MPEYRVNFEGEECRLVFREYVSGRRAGPAGGGTALVLETTRESDDAPLHFATATVWLPDIPAGHVAIKTYGENTGMLTALIKAGIVSQPVEWRPSGFVNIPICKLLVEPV